MTFSSAVLYFTAYSLLGWFFESIFTSMYEKKVLNRGFLFGPVCLVYGVLAVVLLVIQEFFTFHPILLFVLSFIIITLLELATSWLMEKLFNIHWWDCRRFKLNLFGRVWLPQSLFAAVISVLILYFVHPYLASLLAEFLTRTQQRVFASLLIAAFIADFIYTLNVLMRLEEHLKKLHAALEYFPKNKDSRREEAPSFVMEEMMEHPDSVYRFISSFPTMRHKQRDKDLKWLRESLENRSYKFFPKLFGKIKAKWTAPFPKRIKKSRAASFARGLNPYKLLWIFVIASVIGYVVETLYCLVRRGYIESRQGLIYGPFSQIYGLGAVLMVLLLYRLRKKSDIWLFLSSGLIGGLFEILCAVIQENVFHTSSWGYDGSKMSIGAGRTSFMYMLFWGILGVIFIKHIFPRISRLIERIPNKQGIFFSWVLIVFLTLDILLTTVAVNRWVDRTKGNPPHNVVEKMLDRYYPDTVLEEIYPNMDILTSPEPPA